MMTKEFILENCAGDLPSCLEAERGGATRIELCAALPEGGTTPSFGLVALAVERCQLPILPIIRPRAGDFLYSSDEAEVMLRDIRMLRTLGVAGFSLGALTPDGRLDSDLCKALIREAKGLPVTLHRAFDRCRDLEEALEEAIRLGFASILTSGGCPSAPEALDTIARLRSISAGRITIMAGSGITAANAREVVRATGVTALHGTFRRRYRSEMDYSCDRFPEASEATIPEADHFGTDAETIRRIRLSLSEEEQQDE